MVECVKAGGVGGAAQVDREGPGTGAGRFSVADPAVPLNANARLSSVSTIGVASMLALQAVDEAVERDRPARKRATAIIAVLTRLQRSILAEDDPSSVLDALNELTADSPTAADPGLGAIVRAVILRSRIEVARRERRRGGRQSD
jgi:hypothetical protein